MGPILAKIYKYQGRHFHILCIENKNKIGPTYRPRIGLTIELKAIGLSWAYLGPIYGTESYPPRHTIEFAQKLTYLLAYMECTFILTIGSSLSTLFDMSLLNDLTIYLKFERMNIKMPMLALS